MLRAAAVAAHAIGNGRQQHAALPRMRQQGGIVLLFGPVARVQGNAAIDGE